MHAELSDQTLAFVCFFPKTSEAFMSQLPNKFMGSYLSKKNTIIRTEVCIERLTTELNGDKWSVACAPMIVKQFPRVQTVAEDTLVWGSQAS